MGALKMSMKEHGRLELLSRVRDYWGHTIYRKMLLHFTSESAPEIPVPSLRRDLLPCRWRTRGKKLS